MADKSNGSHDLMLPGAALLFLGIAITKFQKWYFASGIHRLECAGFLGLLTSIVLAWALLKRAQRKADENLEVLAEEDGAIYCGKTSEKHRVYIKTYQRTMHTQVIGTTNAGKTESVILPWAIQDIHLGRGLLLIDGKSDNSLLEKLWGYTVTANRQSDFRLFSLSNIKSSISFNPLYGGTAEEVAERVFNAFDFESSFYRGLQYECFVQVLRIFEEIKEIPTFVKVHQAITNIDILTSLEPRVTSPAIKEWIVRFRNLSGTEREQRTIGLTTQLGHFAFGAASKIFNQETPDITVDDALKTGKIVYFQLPVMLSPFLGKATGKLILQSLQAAIANRQRSREDKKNFFSVFLDDFSEYLYPGFVTVLNKSRSANVGIVFAHQALGDIKGLGESVENAILTNSNLKIFMRGLDPDSTEYFAKVVGTSTTTKRTERLRRGLFSEQETGDVSSRDVEEFIIHPNYFKKEMGVGQAVMVIPHTNGSKTVKLKFSRIPDLKVGNTLPEIELPEPIRLCVDTSAPSESKSEATPKTTVLAVVSSKEST